MKNVSKKGIIFTIIFIITATAGIFGLYSGDRPEGVSDNGDAQIQSIDWNESEISTAAGDTLVTADDVPGSMQVSEGSEFGASGAITGALLSPDAEWVAFSTAGAAHDAGWLYEVSTEEVSPAAFQYGGGLEVREWSPDSRFIAFTTQSPASTSHILVVDRNNLDGYVSNISHQIQVDAEADMNPPFSYNFQRWKSPHSICFTFEDGSEQCMDASSLKSSSKEAGVVSTDNWQQYTHEDFDFIFRYPEEADTRIENDRVKVTFLGPDNTMGSEITDGFTFYVDTVNPANIQTLQEVAEVDLASQPDHLTVVEQVSPIEISDRQGYGYIFETALGIDATIMFLATDSDEVLRISYSVSDPEDEGYLKMINSMIQTIEI